MNGLAVENATSKLEKQASLSTRCRSRITNSLIAAMAQPAVPNMLGKDPERYALWWHGTALLVELQATEALDLLIENIAVTDGLSTSLSHYAAVGALINFGEVAIPKLQAVLTHDSDRYRRQFAVFCIASIGGNSAKQVFTQVVPRESDECVSNFIRTSPAAFQNSRTPNHISGKDHARWYGDFYCPGSPETTTQSVRSHSSECFQETELRESIATLKQQGGAAVVKVSESLLTKSRTAYGCRTQVVQALISSMEQATNPTTNQYENFFLWLHGASVLADLNATEALDLLIANVDFTDGWSASINESHFPALAAILRIGQPAIPKLQVVLSNDSKPHRRKFAAFAIAYIGGGEAKKALQSALPRESDPCVKEFLQVSLQAFANKTKPNQISSELNGKWLAAFYCRSVN